MSIVFPLIIMVSLHFHVYLYKSIMRSTTFLLSIYSGNTIDENFHLCSVNYRQRLPCNIWLCEIEILPNATILDQIAGEGINVIKVIVGYDMNHTEN